jgi:hypothetical protein
MTFSVCPFHKSFLRIRSRELIIIVIFIIGCIHASFLKSSFTLTLTGGLHIQAFQLPHLSEYHAPRAFVRVRAGSGILLSRIP